jgi:hypothetical protein
MCIYVYKLSIKIIRNNLYYTFEKICIRINFCIFILYRRFEKQKICFHENLFPAKID